MSATEISKKKKRNRAWEKITEKEILKERKRNKDFKAWKGYKIELKIGNERREKKNLRHTKNKIQKKNKKCSELRESKSKIKVWAKTEDGRLNLLIKYFLLLMSG